MATETSSDKMVLQDKQAANYSPDTRRISKYESKGNNVPNIKEIGENILQVSMTLPATFEEKDFDDENMQTRKWIYSKVIEAKEWLCTSNPRKGFEICKEILKLDQHNLEALDIIIRIYLQAERPDVALTYAKRAAKSWPNNYQIKYRLGECFLSLKDGERALQMLQEYKDGVNNSGGQTAYRTYDIQVLLAKAYQMLGQNEKALMCIRIVVKETKEYVPALVEYAPLTFDADDVHAFESATILVTAIIRDKGNKYYNRKFVDIISRKGGLAALRRAAKDAWKQVSSIIFLGMTLRNNGSVDLCIALYEHALSLKPDHTNCMLLYVHTLWAQDDYIKVMKVVKKYFKDYPKMKVNFLSNDLMSRYLESLPDDFYLYGKDPVISNLMITFVSNPTIEEKELYLVALWFSIVKYLFVKGAIKACSHLLQLVDTVKCQLANEVAMMKAEVAYLELIQNIITKTMPGDEKPAIDPNSDFIYHLGDSHCLPTAWRTIEYKGKAHVLHPLLCTGLKIWHLRDEETFYTRSHFYKLIDHIPKKATVIFNFGEMDCRETLEKCVRKCKYESLEEGIENLIDVYMRVLNKLQQKNRWTIFVHPISPVNEKQRQKVMIFNKMLKERLKLPQNLHYLDITDSILQGNDEINLNYALDGAHLHPITSELIEASMNKTMANR